MATEAELSLVQSTLLGIIEIEKNLEPLLLLQESHNSLLNEHSNYTKLKHSHSHSSSVRAPPLPPPPPPLPRSDIADVNTAIALAISSLSFIRLRLTGVEVTKTHPVRAELKRIRAVMQKIRSMRSMSPSPDPPPSSLPSKRPPPAPPPTKEDDEAKVIVREGEAMKNGTVLKQPKKKVKKTKRKSGGSDK